MAQYMLGIDQSTQGTKALIFDENGALICRADLAHRQIINEKGWVEHDPEEIYRNTLQVVKDVVDKAAIHPNDLAGVGISNQRETSLAWNEEGKPICNAIVWQCARAAKICDRIERTGVSDQIYQATGIRLSPYFPASKIAWIMENMPEARQLAKNGQLHYGTIDSFLVYRLTHGKVYRTDYSNASRTQLFNLKTLTWDEDMCRIFGISRNNLAEVTDSDGYYGETNFEGYLRHAIPIHGILGDSHGALLGQGCLQPGMIKTTYGTGSSIMMNIGDKPIYSKHGVVTSLAWSINGKVNYVLEGNINYTGAVITWLKDDLKLISSAAETENIAKEANPDDHSYLVPAFTGLGAPYWDSKAQGILCNLTRTTKRAEIVRDALQCIAYQITDIVKAMQEDTNIRIKELRVDGGPTKNKLLMQFQSDITRIPVMVPPAEELSGMGAAYAAGIGLGIYNADDLFSSIRYNAYMPNMPAEIAQGLYDGWKEAVSMVIQKTV